MRTLTIALLACFAACGSSTKPLVRAEPFVPQTEVTAKLGDWHVAFRIGPGWSLDPDKQSKDALILDAVGKQGLAMAVMLEPALPDSKAQDAAAKWQGYVILARAYEIKNLGSVITSSDEDAAFSIHGTDHGVPVTTTGIVHLVRSNSQDVWAIALIYGHAEHIAYASKEAQRILRSFRLQPPK